MPDSYGVQQSWFKWCKTIMVPMMYDKLVPMVPRTIMVPMMCDNHVFFLHPWQGHYYWKFYNFKLIYVRSIAEGFKGIPDNIDASFVWGGNGKTYFIKGKFEHLLMFIRDKPDHFIDGIFSHLCMTALFCHLSAWPWCSYQSMLTQNLWKSLLKLWQWLWGNVPLIR